MLLSKITQLVYCSLPQVPIVLQGILLEYYGSFYEVELTDYTGPIDKALLHDWKRLVPLVVEDTCDHNEQTITTASTPSLYTRLQCSIQNLPQVAVFGVTGMTGMTGATGYYGGDNRTPIVVSAEHTKLLFMYHPQLKDTLIFHAPLKSFLIPHKYSRFEYLTQFFLKLNMFVALPMRENVRYGATFRIAISLA